MKKFGRFFAAMTASLMCMTGLSLETISAEEAKKTVLFSGSATKKFTTWDEWDKAVGLGNNEFDVNDFTEPFTMTVDYESSGSPVLVFFSWTGGPSWCQMNPTYTANGTAYYTYDTICENYGDDFSLLNGINVMPGGANLTVTEVAFFYEGAQEEIAVEYTGLAGEIVNDINAGWNLGNTLDSFGDWIYDYSEGTPSDFEKSWGNPITTKAMIDDVKSAGFNAVRIPVTWTQHIDDANSYAIDKAWMDRVQEIVDYVICNDMYCILNVHHDVGGNSWLKASENNIAKNGDKFKAVWTQIATRFEGYDSKLMFEGFNEILDESNNWGYPGTAATSAVNTLNQMFVDTVRATGGNNAERVLIVNTYAAGTNGSSQDDFVVPTDTAENSLIVEMHYYDPGAYCGEISADGNTQSVWTDGGGKSAMDGMLYNVYTHFTSKGIPVILGEFGAHNKDNESDRADYAGYLVENAKKYGIKCFWWDAGGKTEADSEFGYYKGMALYDRYNSEWIFPEIVKAITGVDVTSASPVVEGDVNADGKFTVADVVALQKWLLGVPDAHLANWKAADLCEDNKLDVFDLSLVKRRLLNNH